MEGKLILNLDGTIKDNTLPISEEEQTKLSNLTLDFLRDINYFMVKDSREGFKQATCKPSSII